MPLNVEIVTAERSVLETTADMVVAPGSEGVLGILPRHAPMIALLKAGELRIKQGAEETVVALTGGVMQVQPTRVIVLADAAERAEEIDEARAREAMERARQHMSDSKDRADQIELIAAIERANVRLRVVQRRRRTPEAPPRE